METKTICAISTPLGTGGICIIRLSGDKSLEIAKQLFNSESLDYSNINPRYLYFGNFSYEDFSDKCMMVYFKSPFSYTGEDVVEFQCHGGELVAEKVLKACIKTGAVLAEGGEFTKQAFINGKLSLDQAESVIDTINATSEAELKASSRLMNGELYKIVKEQQDVLTSCLAKLEVALDYPEHDIEEQTINATKIELEKVFAILDKINNNSQNGQIIKSGINIAIVGKPNVGKSSLLNALLNEERAIVTDIAGTTRDTIKETVVYHGLKLNFIDTAGLRESCDTVERIGIERAKQELDLADIILFVIDSNIELTDEEKSYLKKLENKNYLIINNKIDKKSQINEKNINYFEKNNKLINNIINISAKNKINIELIFEKIIEKSLNSKLDFSSLLLTNQRQLSALSEALMKIKNAINVCQNESADIVCFLIKEIWECLGKITGETENENIIDAIFSKFCLGK